MLIERFPRLLGQLEPDGTSGFLLTHRCAIDHKAVWSNVPDFEADDVAASELAINGEVEHGKVAIANSRLIRSPTARSASPGKTIEGTSRSK